MTELTMLVNDNFDLNRVSTEGGVDVYMDILEFIGQKIEQQLINLYNYVISSL